jgi:hypothetical protein
LCPFYLPLKNEIKTPKKPRTAIPITTIPIGTALGPILGAWTSKVGIVNGGGGVKVGKRVGGNTKINWAANVGSTVGVVRGVGVGGGSTIGIPPETVTNGE